MSEQPEDYITDALEMIGAGHQPAAIIDPPRVVRSLQDGGLKDYQVWGWVKTSAKFRAHIKILRGAKHDIWHYLALGVDENGKCKETIKQICEGTGYSHTEVINTLRELNEMGYLSVQKDSKGNIYTPEFVARGEKKPSESAVNKVESTPVYQVESTPQIEESPAIPLRVKRVNTKKPQIKGIEAAMFGGREVTEEDIPSNDEALKAFERDLQCPGSWSWYPAKSSDEPAWKSLREFVVKTYQSDPKAFEKYYTWARDPFSRGAKLPIHIRQDPTCFEYAWQAYQAANPGQVNSTGKVTTDKHGIVESW